MLLFGILIIEGTDKLHWKKREREIWHSKGKYEEITVVEGDQNFAARTPSQFV